MYIWLVTAFAVYIIVGLTTTITDGLMSAIAMLLVGILFTLDRNNSGK